MDKDDLVANDLVFYRPDLRYDYVHLRQKSRKRIAKTFIFAYKMQFFYFLKKI